LQIPLFSQPMWALEINLLLNQLIVLGPQQTPHHQVHQLLNGKSALRSNQAMCLRHQVIRRALSITIQAASSKLIQLTLLLKIRLLLQIKQLMEHPLLTKQVMRLQIRQQMAQLQLIALLMGLQLQIKQPIQPQIKQIIRLFHPIKLQI
jgi:hypothetical protein